MARCQRLGSPRATLTDDEVGGDIVDTHAEQLVAGVTQSATGLRVTVHDTPTGVVDQQGVHGLLEKRGVEGLGLGELPGLAGEPPVEHRPHERHAKYQERHPADGHAQRDTVH